MDEALIEKKKVRFNFLNKIYDIAGGNSDEHIDSDDIIRELGFENNIEPLKLAVNYLKGEYLIEDTNQFTQSTLGILKITHEGVREIENAISHPSQATTYFEPVDKIIHQSITIKESSDFQIGNGNIKTSITNSVDNRQLFESIENTLINEVTDTTEKKLILAKLTELEASLGVVQVVLLSIKSL